MQFQFLKKKSKLKQNAEFYSQSNIENASIAVHETFYYFMKNTSSS